MTKISAVINTINEEANIARCLDSLGFVDEIIVVDMESQDQTQKIAYQYTPHVYTHKPMGYVEPARNFAIHKATGDWILILDADEVIPKSLANRLIALADENKFDFVRLPRKNIIFNEWVKHSRWWPDHNIRFFKKGSVQWQDAIHSVPITFGEGLTLESQEDLAIVHYHYQNLEQYLTRMLRYADIQAKDLLKENYQFSFADILVKPSGEFLSRFFAGEGYKDGFHGLVLALLQSFSTLITYLKIWQQQDFLKTDGQKFYILWWQTIHQVLNEFNFWQSTMKIHLTSSKFSRFILKLKRKIGL